MNMTTATNYESRLTVEASSHEEADTVIIMHAVDAADAGFGVHIYSQDTNVLLLALRRVSQVGSSVALIMGTGERRHKVMFQPIYDELGPQKAVALINWHVLTGCDTTGHIQGKGKKGCFTAFLVSSPAVLSAMFSLDLGQERL